MDGGGQQTTESEPKEQEVTRRSEDEDDPELDELLDSALEDFSKPTSCVNTAAKATPQASQARSSEDIAFPSEGDGAAVWSEEFLQQASAGLEDAVRALMSDDPKTADDFKKFAEMASKAVAGEVSEEELTSLTQGFLTGIAASTQDSVDNQPPVSEEELAKMFNSLGSNLPATEDGDLPDMTSVMQNMMHMLLSKDLLYPALKDITEKYPGWLADNRTTLSTEQYGKYNTQYEIMKKVCDEFEAESPTETADEKRARFERVLEWMQKMQECGQPPPDLVGEMGSGLEFDENGLPRLPGLTGAGESNEKCNLM